MDGQSRRSVLVGSLSVAVAANAGTGQAQALPASPRFLNVSDFGAIADGVTDDTKAFNRVTRADERYSRELRYGVWLANGTTVLGEGNSTVYLRKGQTFAGQGMGASWLDLSHRTGNTQPIIKLGERLGQIDPDEVSSGAAVEAHSFTSLGGPATAPVIDTNACAGWSVHEIFFSSPGIGIRASGGDGLISSCFFDDGLNGLVVSGGNMLISNCNFYLANQQVTITSGAHNVNLNGNHHEYFKIYGILLAGNHAKGIAIRGSAFLQNEQFANSHAIFLNAHGGDYVVHGCTFRNLRGAGFKYGSGVGNAVVIEDCIFDGSRTHNSYAQSTTMQGVDLSNCNATVRGGEMRNLSGQPITIGGGERITVIIDGVMFRGNSGGGGEILYSNTHPSSLLIVRNCVGNGRPILVKVGSGKVIYENNNSREIHAAIVLSSSTLTLPFDARVITLEGGADLATITALSEDYQRVVTIVFGQGRTVKHGTGNLKLAGGVDFVAAADDTLTLVNSTGTGSWHEISRAAARS